MKLWHHPARLLPATTPPLAGELLGSYTRRLSQLNGLRETAVLRALGTTYPTGSGYHLLTRDAALNPLALRRLSHYTGIPTGHLARALPGLSDARRSQLPADIPASRWFPAPAVAPCRRCAARHGADRAIVRPAQLICERHRYLACGEQCDLSAAPEIMRAWKQRWRLPARTANREVMRAAIEEAWDVTSEWHALTYEFQRHKELTLRWEERAARLRPSTGYWFRRALVLPEAIALARILGDLDWRRHVAMVRELDLRIFYRHVAHRIGADEQRLTVFGHSDPLQKWADTLRIQHAWTRTTFWAQATQLYRDYPFPEKSHFK